MMKILSKIRLNDMLYHRLSLLFLALMVVAVPSSRLLMSIGQIALLALWLWNGAWRQKWHAFANNKVAWVLVLFFLWHVVGLSYSQDMDYAMKDLRTKLPLLILPLVFTALPPLSMKQFRGLMMLFVGSVFYVSLFVSLRHLFTDLSFQQLLGRHFVSHVRYGLNMDMAIFSLVFLWWSQPSPRLLWHIGYGSLLLWLLFAMLFLKAFTTVAIFLLLLGVMALLYLFSARPAAFKAVVVALLLLLVSALGLALYRFVDNNTQDVPVVLSELDSHSPYGTPYEHRIGEQVENGRQVFVYVAETEMAQAWAQRSALPYAGLDKRQQQLRYTLMRYLTSKGLRKDKDGVMALTDSDVHYVEAGVANVHYTEGLGVKARLYKILFEYKNYKRSGDPSGHSVMQRIEFWKTAWHIIKQHPWLGVGTGDPNMAFAQAYEDTHSLLAPEYRHRSHNQYLSVWVSLGLVGLLLFVFTLLYPPLKLAAFRNPYYLVFFSILVLSMLSEDTLESQAGLTFYAFFNSFLLLIAPKQLTQQPIP